MDPVFYILHFGTFDLHRFGPCLCVIWTSIAKEPYIFVIFQGGVDPLSPPPLDPQMMRYVSIEYPQHIFS